MMWQELNGHTGDHDVLGVGVLFPFLQPAADPAQADDGFFRSRQPDQHIQIVCGHRLGPADQRTACRKSACGCRTNQRAAAGCGHGGWSRPRS